MPRTYKKPSNQHYQSQQSSKELIFYTSYTYPIINSSLHFLLFSLLLCAFVVTIILASNGDKNGFLPLFALFVVLFAGWRTWNAVSQIRVRKPLLLINNIGIFIYELPTIDVLSRNFSVKTARTSYPDPPKASLLWEEIGSIIITRMLIVIPKDIAPQGYRRLTTKTFSVSTGKPIFVEKRYSELPLKEIVRQIRSTYDNKLKRYQIEIE